MQEAELNLTTIDIPELVLRNICSYCPEDEEGMVMVYLAKERGLVVITRQSTLYLARSLDLGYDALLASADKAGDLGLDSFNAEFDRLTLEIQRSLDYYDRYFNQSSVAGIVLAPTEQPIPGLLEYLNSNLGLSASTLDLNQIVSTPQPIDLSHQANCLLAIGAALRQEKKTL